MKKNTKRFVCAGFICLCLSGYFSFGKTIHVSPCGNDFWTGLNEICQGPDGPKKTIQSAINSVLNGDVVILADGVYKGVGNRDISFNGKAITVKSRNGYMNCIIDCEATPTNPHRAFIFNSQEGPDSILEGIAIFKGMARGSTALTGGGIKCNGGSPTIQRCYISQCTAGTVDGVFVTGGAGGAIACIGSSAIIDLCVFSVNSALQGGLVPANGLGGAVYVSGDSQVKLNRCIFEQNQAHIGGGVSVYGKSVTIENCIFEYNEAFSGGGMSVWCQEAGLVRMCLVQANRAEKYGGGILVGENTTLRNVTICGNIMSNSNLFEKTYGGGVHCIGENSLILNCTVHMNQVNQFAQGAGIGWDGGMEPHIVNSILWDNKINLLFDGEQLPPGNPYVMYCDIKGGYPGPGNIEVDPNFIRPGHWHNGQWQDGNYHLQSQQGWWNSSAKNWDQSEQTSGCIDMGIPYEGPDDPDTVYSDYSEELWPHGGRINLGTFGGTDQASWSSRADIGKLADINRDGKVDQLDLRPICEFWMHQENRIHMDLNRDGRINMIDIAVLGLDWFN